MRNSTLALGSLLENVNKVACSEHVPGGTQARHLRLVVCPTTEYIDTLPPSTGSSGLPGANLSLKLSSPRATIAV